MGFAIQSRSYQLFAAGGRENARVCRSSSICPAIFRFMPKRPAILRSMPKRTADGCISAGISWDRPTGVSKLVSPNINLTEPPKLTSPSKKRIAPWLMLPPALDESGDLVYNLYSLAEKKVLSLGNLNGEEESESKLPAGDFKLVGSSHGWVALFNHRNNDLFLSNPVSRRHIKLPPIDTLPNPEINLRNGCGSVSKVALSCSPDEKECRAMMTFGPGDRLAFCVPGFSAEWTPIGNLFNVYDHAEPYDLMQGRVYEDFVYCSGRNVFSCVTATLEYEMEHLWGIDEGFFPPEREDWDIRDPHCPTILGEAMWLMTWVERKEDYKTSPTLCWLRENKELLEKHCIQIPQLLYAEQSDQLFLLMRFVMPRVGPYGEPDGLIPLYTNGLYGLLDIYPQKTVAFLVLEIHREGEMTVVDSLNDLVMFVGGSHSFAVSSSDFPELQPNSIYFTDARRFCGHRPCFGNHDVGIFDHEKKSILPIYDPCQIQSFNGIQSPYMWFTPTHF